jgi:hypothetical protein
MREIFCWLFLFGFAALSILIGLLLLAQEEELSSSPLGVPLLLATIVFLVAALVVKPPKD